MVTRLVGSTMIAAVVLAYATGWLPLNSTQFLALVWTVGLGTIGMIVWKHLHAARG